MKRRDLQLVQDMLDAIDAIARHQQRGPIDSELVFDAVRMRLIEIGEAAKGLSDQVKGSAPDIPWRHITGMRDRLTHRYFENELDIIRSTVENDLQALAAALAGFSRAAETE